MTTRKSTKKSKKQKVKSVAIMYRPRKAKAFSLAKDVAQWLLDRGVKVYSSPGQKVIPGTKTIPTKEISKIDLYVVLGGDGTYLGAVRSIDGHEIPVLGINLGSLGFLTESRVGDTFDLLERAIEGKLKFEERTMLAVELLKRNKKPSCHLALNDVVIERGPISRLISLAIFSNGQLVSELKADGLMITTPTGSTAYNLAAGGPIVHPDVRAIVITPICPHSLTNRPITVPDDHEIRIRVTQSTQKAVFMVDGQKYADIRDEDEIIIKRSVQSHHRFVSPSSNYFSVLRTKLKFGQRD